MSQHDNWVRELSYGRNENHADTWLINENTFWQRWSGNGRIFVFVNENYMDQFTAKKRAYYVLGRYHDIILLSNHPVPAKN
jgi:hypothetical protein